MATVLLVRAGMTIYGIVLGLEVDGIGLVGLVEAAVVALLWV